MRNNIIVCFMVILTGCGDQITPPPTEPIQPVKYITCTPPDSYADGTPIEDAISYRLYCRTATEGYIDHVERQECRFELPQGKEYCVATALVRGIESKYSNELDIRGY